MRQEGECERRGGRGGRGGSVLQCTAALPYCFKHEPAHGAAHHGITATGAGRGGGGLRQAKRGLKMGYPN